jgi:hypothetical protein
VDFVVETSAFEQHSRRGSEGDWTLFAVADGAHGVLSAFRVMVVWQW